MASSENLVALEPWALRPGFNDPWFADVFSRETEALTKVLQKSMFGAPPPPESFPVFKPEETPAGTPSASGPTVSGGSENETAGSKRRSVGSAAGKIKKRKSRASKSSTTTYITADAAHFRQMVQQVTGFKFAGAGHVPVAPILKPEPQRAVQRLQPSGCLPTLDTSAFLLDQNKQPQTVDPTALLHPAAVISPPPPPPPPRMDADASCASGFDFDFFSSFPTLDSWKTVM